MSLADELLQTGQYLLRQNSKKPTDASVRRAISTAYYALFHRLIESATACLVPTPDQQQSLARLFDHGKMRRVCEALNAKTVSPALATILGASIPGELKQVADTFVELQDRRHDADYNLGRRFGRAEASDFLKRVEEAFEAWKRIPPAVANPFLLLLLLGEPKAR